MPFGSTRLLSLWSSGIDAEAFDPTPNTLTISDTWAFELGTNRWTNLNPKVRPPGRFDFALAYDARADRVILFGGRGTTPLNDTWSYDRANNTWTDMNPASRPSSRVAQPSTSSSSARSASSSR